MRKETPSALLNEKNVSRTSIDPSKILEKFHLLMDQERMDLASANTTKETLIEESVIHNKSEMNSKSFSIATDHKDIWHRRLNKIKPVNLKEVIGIDTGDELTPKQYVVAVIKQILEISIAFNWNLGKAGDGIIYIYNGAFWKSCDKESSIKKFLKEAAIKMGMKEYEAKHYEFADRLYKQFLSDAPLLMLEPDENMVLINLLNGTFEFTPDGMKKREFSPNDFLTYQLPYSYDPSATCPLFDKFLLRVLPDECCSMVLQEFSGFIFTKLNLEKFLVLTGGGGNGKSVFMNILCALIGSENTLNYPIGQFSHEYKRAKLANKLLNYSSEKGFDLNPDTFKALIAGEKLQARNPYGQSFTLLNKAKFITNCNVLPKETERTDAYFRRFLIIPFDEKITEEEKDISLAQTIISTELSGVFNWLLEGLNRILQQRRFTYSEKSERVLSEFRKQGDSVQLYIEEWQFQTSIDKKESVFELYNRYKNFCYDEGQKPLGKNNFSKTLASKGFERARMNNGESAFLIEKKKEIVL